MLYSCLKEQPTWVLIMRESLGNASGKIYDYGAVARASVLGAHVSEKISAENVEDSSITASSVQKSLDAMEEAREPIYGLIEITGSVYQEMTEHGLDTVDEAALLEHTVLSTLKMIRDMESEARDIHDLLKGRYSVKAGDIYEFRRQMAIARTNLSNLAIFLQQNLHESSSFEGRVPPEAISEIATIMTRRLGES